MKFTGLWEYFCKIKIKRVTGNYDTIISFLEGMALHFHSFLMDRAGKNITFVHTDLEHYPISITSDSIWDYNRMDTIVFVSENAHKSFVKVFPTNVSNHIILPNFIDVDKVVKKSKDIKVEKKTPTIICVGRLEKVKGFEILIDIVNVLCKKLDKFLIRIVGTGEEEVKLKTLIQQSGFENYFIFEGFKSNPYPYIANADILLSTSLAEGFSLVICEAMALGIPVISSKTDGAISLLGDGTGILVDRNPNEYSDSILNLLHNRELYDYHVSKGLEKSLKHDKSEYMQRLYTLF